jgi:hypothetical protein
MLRFLCLFLFIANLAVAQDKKFRWPKRPKPGPAPVVIPPKPGLVISTNVFSLHEFEAGPSLALEYRTSLHWAVILEGTALVYTLDEGDYGTGFRIQPELRYYFPGKHRSFRGFFSLQGTYKQTTFQDSTFREVLSGSNPTGIDYEPVYYEAKKRILAAGANIGFQVRLGRGDRIMIEMYAGLGLKFKDLFGKPAGTVEPMDRIIQIIPKFEEPGTYLHIPMGVRMGYCF